jgi:hypothetical protein
MQQERRQEPRTVLAADAVDDDAALRRVRDGAHRGRDVRLEALEEDQVRLARRGLDVRCGGRRALELLRDLLPLRVARLHERDVDDLDRQVGGRIVLALVVATEVEDCANAVLHERAPALVAELRHAVGPHDRAEARLAPIGRRQAAEVADVQAPVPDQISSSMRQLLRAGCP